MLLDGEAVELSRFCVELSAGRFEGKGCWFLLVIPFAYFGFSLGQVFEFIAVLSFAPTGPSGGPGVVWNWHWRVYLDWVVGKNS